MVDLAAPRSITMLAGLPQASEPGGRARGWTNCGTGGDVYMCVPCLSQQAVVRRSPACAARRRRRRAGRTHGCPTHAAIGAGLPTPSCTPCISAWR
jgi:hypothetical protein